jgi:hypothetical protein
VLGGPLKRVRRHAKWAVRRDGSRRMARSPGLDVWSENTSFDVCREAVPFKEAWVAGLEVGPKGTILSVRLTAAPLRRFGFPDREVAPRGTIFGTRVTGS